MDVVLRLETSGKLGIEEVGDDTYQCGPRGTRDLFYRVEIECPAEARDERGFIIDAQDIHRILRERYRRVAVLPSCETLAVDAAEALSEECVDAKCIRVSIGTEEVAYMTATYTRRKPRWRVVLEFVQDLFRLF